jgi:hypothetical protein
MISPRLLAAAAFNVSSAVNATLDCDYHGLTDFTTKFILLLVVTPGLCAFGIVANFANICVFMKKSMRTTNNSLLAALAFCDIGVITTAVLIYSVEVAYDFYGNFSLYRAWIQYLKTVFFVSHVFQCSAVYMTVAATVERWIATGHPKQNYRFCRYKNVWFTVMAVLLGAVAFNIPKYFEIDVVEKPWCDGFAFYGLQPSALARNPTYAQVYTVWMTNLVVMILPFMLLFLLNVLIVVHMKHAGSGDSQDALVTISVDMSVVREVKRRETRMKLRSKRREATVVLLVVVLVFLVCNTPGLLLTLLERIDQRFLERNPRFYSYTKDAINVLTIINSVVNFVIYVTFGNDFRKELRGLVDSRSSRKWSMNSRAGSKASQITIDMVTTNDGACVDPEGNLLMPEGDDAPDAHHTSRM